MDALIGVCVLIFQYSVYAIILNETKQDYQNDLVPLKIKHEHCTDLLGCMKDDHTATLEGVGDSIHHLKCDASQTTLRANFVTMSMSNCF